MGGGGTALAQGVELLALLLSAVGLTALVVWPEHGPAAWLREKLARPLLGKRAGAVLDCYICAGFWCGLALGAAWWVLYRHAWCWFGCLMVPGFFWLVLPGSRGQG